jgi:hypothetical protein
MAQIKPYGLCIHACSACSGDYEDPERTAPSGAPEGGAAEAEDEERAGDVQPRLAREDFLFGRNKSREGG